jgi:hypothetical protein
MEATVPHDIALFDAYVPLLLLLAFAGAAVTWLSTACAATPACIDSSGIRTLVRASLLTCARCDASR